MEHSVLGQVGRAVGVWGQACLVLLRNPIFLVWQIAVAALIVFFRSDALLLGFSFLMPLNFTITHYTMRFLHGEQGGYKKSFEASFSSYSIYLALFLPFLCLFFLTNYGQELFFAAFGIGEADQHNNIFVARVLFGLLVALLLCIFIFQHMEAVITWTGEKNLKKSAKRACYLIWHNKVIVVTLTCLFFLTCVPLLLLLKNVAHSMDLGNTTVQAFKAVTLYLGDLFLPYYVITLSINLYCMALTILYYDKYVKHERASQ